MNENFQNGRLTKVSDNSNAIRLNGIPGHFYEKPCVGSAFTIFADSLTPGNDLRIVSTSLVTKLIEQDSRSILFQTLNSSYLLEIFDEQNLVQ